MKEITDAVVELDEDKVMDLVNYFLDINCDPDEIIASVQQGVIAVGNLYQNGKYFIADLIMAGIIFKEVLNLLESKNKGSKSIHPVSLNKKILLGTVQSDLHDIGKDMFAAEASVRGFEVIDLGVDVPPEMFLQKYNEIKPDIIAMSGVLTQSIKYMKLVVDLLKSSGVRNEVKVLIGGGALTQEVSQIIGANAFAKDGSEGIAYCEEWIKQN